MFGGAGRQVIVDGALGRAVSGEVGDVGDSVFEFRVDQRAADVVKGAELKQPLFIGLPNIDNRQYGGEGGLFKRCNDFGAVMFGVYDD